MFPSRLYRTTRPLDGRCSVEVILPDYPSQTCTVAPLLPRRRAGELAKLLQNAYNQGVLDTRQQIVPNIQTLRDTLDLAANMDKHNPRPNDTDAKGRAQGFARSVMWLDKILEGVI